MISKDQVLGVAPIPSAEKVNVVPAPPFEEQIQTIMRAFEAGTPLPWGSGHHDGTTTNHLVDFLRVAIKRGTYPQLFLGVTPKGLIFTTGNGVQSEADRNIILYAVNNFPILVQYVMDLRKNEATLEERIQTLLQTSASKDKSSKEMLDNVYRERDQVVAALSKCFPGSLEQHQGEADEWDPEWRWVVILDLPTGQVSWHIHESELPLFDHLPREVKREWDGHTTEEKYQRLKALSDQVSR